MNERMRERDSWFWFWYERASDFGMKEPQILGFKHLCDGQTNQPTKQPTNKQT